jgi:alpha-ketoglutarate-dependent taurine dioxygenase
MKWHTGRMRSTQKPSLGLFRCKPMHAGTGERTWQEGVLAMHSTESQARRSAVETSDWARSIGLETK